MAIAIFVVAGTAGVTLHAQRFDVASVRPSAPDDKAAAATPRSWGDVTGRVTLRHIPLKYVLLQVFSLSQDQIVGPGWLESDFFDILAVAPAGTPKDQIALMFQTLLAERFNLRFHRETRIAAVYALVVAPGGPKMKESVAYDADAYKDIAHMSGTGENKIISGTGQGPFGPFRLTAAKGVVHSEFVAMTMDGLARYLSQSSDRPVIDGTGLKGSWQVVLENSPGTRLTGLEDDAPGANQGAGDLLRESLQKLGLKLVPQKVPSEKFVIDHIERSPSEN
jgi:uncharacterized protein (TIGR03435 family)